MRNPSLSHAVKWAVPILAVMIASGFWSFRPASAEATKTNPLEVQRRGHDLRNAVLKLYQELRASHASTTLGVDMSKLVASYIPVGTSFADANDILRAAGFKVHTSVPVMRSPQRITWATLALYRGFLLHTTAHVQLYPERDHDPAQRGAAVDTIVAFIVTPTL